MNYNKFDENQWTFDLPDQAEENTASSDNSDSGLKQVAENTSVPDRSGAGYEKRKNGSNKRVSRYKSPGAPRAAAGGSGGNSGEEAKKKHMLFNALVCTVCIAAAILGTCLATSQLWPGRKYKVTVENGSGNGEYRAGDDVTIQADPAKDGYTFISWSVSDENVISRRDRDRDRLVFEMPAEDFTVTAEYTEIQYTLTVENGTIEDAGNSSSFTKGTRIAVRADSKDGYTFNTWEVTEGNVVINDASSQDAVVTIGSEDAVIQAVYTENKYTLSIKGGTLEGDKTSGSYTEGTRIDVHADAKDGYTFNKWEVTEGNVTFNDASSQDAVVTIGSEDAVIQAVYTENEYTLSIKGGTLAGGETSGSFTEGTKIDIRADSKVGYTFNKWEVTEGNVAINDAFFQDAVVTIGSEDAVIQAVYTENKYTLSIKGGTLEWGKTSGSRDIDGAAGAKADGGTKGTTEPAVSGSQGMDPDAVRETGSAPGDPTENAGALDQAAVRDLSAGADSAPAAAAAPPVRELEITKQPSEAIVKEGGTAVFKVSATGDGLKYRWQARKPDDEKWHNTEAGDGLETPVLKVPDVNTGRNRFRYRCRITDQHGKTVYTDSVYLYVLGIRSSPKNQNVKADHPATFRISAVGKDLKYMWEYRRSSGEEWQKSTADGSDTAVLRVTNTPAGHNGYRFRCRISDAAGNKTYSKAAVLYVLGIRSDPSAQYVKQGGTAVFKVKASGKGLKYRWQVRLPGEEEWQSCGGEGVDTPTLTLYDLSGGKNNRLYRCRVSDADGKVTYSKGARLYVLSIRSNPASQNIREKQTASFWVEASGGGLRYQWQMRKSSNKSWRSSSSSGHATRNLRVSGRTAYNGYQFRCKVSDRKGNAVYSKTVSLHVFGIRSSPKNQNVKSGSTAVFRVSATGAGLKYHWQVKDRSGSWRGSGSPGHTTSTLKVSARTAYNGYAFRCKVTDSKGRSAYTNVAKLHVFGITSQPSDVLTHSGKTAVFRVRASGAGLKYKWQVKEYSNGMWRNSTSTGHSTNTLKVRAALALDVFQFRCRVTDSAGHSEYTRTVYLWVKP